MFACVTVSVSASVGLADSMQRSVSACVWGTDSLISHVKQIRQLLFVFLYTVEYIIVSAEHCTVYQFLLLILIHREMPDIRQDEAWPCLCCEGTKHYFVMRWGWCQGDLSLIYGLQLPRPCRKVFVIGVPQI